jgi:hypothetical protein
VQEVVIGGNLGADITSSHRHCKPKAKQSNYLPQARCRRREPWIAALRSQ